MFLSPISVTSIPESPVLELDRRDVYPPKPASVLLGRTAARIAETGTRVLDLGTGSGICGLWMKRRVPSARVVMTDNRQAAESITRRPAPANRNRGRPAPVVAGPAPAARNDDPRAAARTAAYSSPDSRS